MNPLDGYWRCPVCGQIEPKSEPVCQECGSLPQTADDRRTEDLRRELMRDEDRERGQL